GQGASAWSRVLHEVLLGREATPTPVKSQDMVLSGQVARPLQTSPGMRKENFSSGAAAPARSRNRVESIGVQRIDFASGSANRLDAPAIKAAGHPDGLEHAVERRTALPGEDAGQREKRRRGPVQGRADAGPLPATGRRRAGTPVSEDA